MTPYEQAKELYKEHPEEFYEILDMCGQVGEVHITDETFVAAYQTSSESIKKKSKKILDKLDTWYVYILAGNPRKAFTLTEKPMKFIAYERFDGKIRLIETKKLENLLWRTLPSGEEGLV